MLYVFVKTKASVNDDHRVQLINKHEDFYNIFRAVEAIEKIKSSSLPTTLHGKDTILLLKINHTMTDSTYIFISLKNMIMQDKVV